MTKQEYLLTVASEECAEIQQAISKALRFGLDACHPDTPWLPNGTQILNEFHQLEAVIGMLVGAKILANTTLEERTDIMDRKVKKVKRYMEVSKELGCLVDRGKGVGL